MSVYDWIIDSAQSIRTNGTQGITESIYELRLGLIRRVSRLNYNPTSIWDQEWDILIVLDACRLDLLQSVEDDYQFLDEQYSLTSVASSTTGWVEKSFDTKYEEELADTAYVTGNPNSIRAFPYEFPEQCKCGTDIEPSYQAVFHEGKETCPSCEQIIDGERQVPVKVLHEVWRNSWDNSIGTIQPRPITDAAISTARSTDCDSLIVHYMQPHHPFIPAPNLDQGSYIAPNDEERKKQSRTIWEQLRTGDVDKETTWREYRNNLQYVLDDVKILLENVDAEVAVITADHGNAIGEYGIYGHPPGTPINPIVTVPWYKTIATDTGRYSPVETDKNGDVTSQEVTDRLRDLGYF
ncbi:hypothetical protein [Haloferax sp. KTX1]|uniref:hypothetical protein n=1 Tax=Haloferax sp. KTX1 TaxID=2600597 RepID=UPI0011DCD777|nr:hypothetical protein [Haloferax sp. KTX1]